MSISVTGKLNEAAKEFPNQSGTNFLVRIGVQVFDYKTKSKVWVNYSGFVFTNNEAQINFYRGALTEGAIIELNGTNVIPEVYGDQNRVTLKVQDPAFGYIGFSDSAAPAPQQAAPQQQQAPQQGYQQAPQATSEPANNFDNFEDDIPFN